MAISKENFDLLKKLAGVMKDRLPPQGMYDQILCNCYRGSYKTVEGIENVGQIGDTSDYLVLVDRGRFYYSENGILMDRQTGVDACAEQVPHSLHSELGFILFHAIFTPEAELEEETWATGIYIKRDSSRFLVAQKIEAILSKIAIDEPLEAKINHYLSTKDSQYTYNEIVRAFKDYVRGNFICGSLMVAIHENWQLLATNIPFFASEIKVGKPMEYEYFDIPTDATLKINRCNRYPLTANFCAHQRESEKISKNTIKILCSDYVYGNLVYEFEARHSYLTGNVVKELIKMPLTKQYCDEMEANISKAII